MNYLRKKVTETILFSGKIEDDEEIKRILQNLKDRRLDANITIKHNPKVYNKSRVIGVDDTGAFTFLYVGDGSLKVKSKFSEIDKLEIVTNDQIIAYTKPNVSRWQMICPSEDL